jgi:regulatory helix-turn-helix LysR family protein
METNQVRYFLALCEKNFTRAAQRCGVSQPSVSNAIKRLEEEIGGDLFHRTKNGTKLSPLGATIRPYLDQINECADAVRHEAAHIPTADILSISARAKFVRKIFYTTAIPACAFFYRSTHRAAALLGHLIAFFGEHNRGRSRFGSDNRSKRFATTECVVGGLSIDGRSISAIGQADIRPSSGPVLTRAQAPFPYWPSRSR